ncbi:peptidylprolyl isomerase fpr4 [Ascosphaera atra]|nr:peptidylprolyl isomerase fpr4 [Ascosphaera atra]
MSAVQPVALYAVRVPPGGVLIPAAADAQAAFRVTMAALDPEQAPEYEDEAAASKPARATLKIVRAPFSDDDDEESDEDYSDEEDEDEESDEDSEEENGGPSDPEKSKKARKAAAKKEIMDAMDEDEESGAEGDDVDLKSAISKLIKGKGKASDDDESDSSESFDLEETVLCTLNPETHYQQALDFTIQENERVFFKVSGTHTIYITGNYVMPAEPYGNGPDSEDEDEDEDDYDLSPDEDELDLMDEDESESDELDDIENPRVQEIESDEEEEEQKKSKKALPASEKKEDKKDKKANKKRAAEEENLDEMMAKEDKKKVKKNDGKAAAPAAAEEKKKVQFAKNLEQGPTPSPPKKDEKKDDKKEEKKPATPQVREVNGVKLDDRKIGEGKVAKKGNTVAMRYIGKLENGKVFDSNKSGKPFSFKLGSGEVIKGWDVGVPGMAVGGERRITIPPHLAYGKRGVPGIPPNATLVFDIKLISIK